MATRSAQLRTPKVTPARPVPAATPYLGLVSDTCLSHGLREAKSKGGGRCTAQGLSQARGPLPATYAHPEYGVLRSNRRSAVAPSDCLDLAPWPGFLPASP